MIHGAEHPVHALGQVGLLRLNSLYRCILVLDQGLEAPGQQAEFAGLGDVKRQALFAGCDARNGIVQRSDRPAHRAGHRASQEQAEANAQQRRQEHSPPQHAGAGFFSKRHLGQHLVGFISYALPFIAERVRLLKGGDGGLKSPEIILQICKNTPSARPLQAECLPGAFLPSRAARPRAGQRCPGRRR